MLVACRTLTTVGMPPTGRHVLSAFQRSLESAHALAVGGAAVFATAAGEITLHLAPCPLLICSALRPEQLRLSSEVCQSTHNSLGIAPDSPNFISACRAPAAAHL